MLGNVFGSGHPIHPITVHYPITALLAAYTCDILVHTRKSLPRLISASLPSTPLLAQIAYYTNAAGLIFLIPSAITGAHEAYEIWKHLGGKKVDGGVVLQAYPERAFNVAAIHGAMNLGVGESGFNSLASSFTEMAIRLGAYALYVWLSRRKNPSHMSTPKQGIASAIFLATLIGSATLVSWRVASHGALLKILVCNHFRAES